MNDIKRVAVLGSGIMGSGIAAHLANCGVPSIMLDIVPRELSGEAKQDPKERNRIAASSKAALLKASPAQLYVQRNADLIEVGNFEDDIARIAECDWIIEVVKEDLEVKKQIFQLVAKHRSPGSLVTTNTSGIPIHSMIEAMDEDMRKHFLGTHFFNPPRYLRLLEIIPGTHTLPEVTAHITRFAEERLGKGVVVAKDTPNFIANRILTFASQYLMHEFTKSGLTVEDVDALTGTNIGHASSATFRTADIVGLDTFLMVVRNMRKACPDDERIEYMEGPAWFERMVERGILGSKTGSGFYKKTNERDETGKAVILSIDVNTLEYKPQQKRRFDCIGAARKAETLEDRVRAMHWGEDEGSQFVWRLFANMAVYAGNRIPEIADDIFSIDRAVKLGFNWDIGVFETWDALGVKRAAERMEKDGLELPPVAKALLESGYESFYVVEQGQRKYFDLRTKSYLPAPLGPKTLILADWKTRRPAVAENGSCSLIDLEDGILCAEFHCKLNTIDGDMVKMLLEGVRRVNDGEFEGLVLANQGEHFSAGANLFYVLGYIMQGDWKTVESAIRGLHHANMSMRFCKGPVVAAPHHYTFGGAVEMCQHAARVVVAGETYGGLVEFGVGIIPAGGGTKEMLRRAQAYVPANVPDGDMFPYVRRAFENIALARVSTSGPEMIELGYFTENDYVSVNTEHQVQRAKDVCRGLLTAGYMPPRPARLVVLGEPVRAIFRSAVYQMRLAGFASEHDALIAEKLSNVLTGGERAAGSMMDEQDVLDLECEAMLSLCGTGKTQQRMQHMLETGKPLRN